MTTLIAAVDPAGGAAIGEVIGATAGAMVATTLLFALGFGHRSGRTQLLERWSGFAARVAGLPKWVALPSAIGTGSLIVALLGMYWDISLHIDQGRDPGPLANPAHYLILFGLFGIFAAGFLAMAIPTEKPCPTAIRLYSGWDVPLGALLMTAAGGFALIGFPLDDMWHRLFGQDVTLWGPTHLMLIGGASISLIGQAILLAEGTRSRPGGRERGVPLRRASLAGGFLIGLSTFQAEFDFGVPQFDFLFQPMLIALAAGIGLVSARLWGGRGDGARRRRVLRRRARLRVADGARRVGRGAAALPALPRRGAAGRGDRGGAAGAARPARLRHRRRPADRHRRHSPPSGAGRTSGCRSRGRRRCCPRSPSSACWPASPAGSWARSSAARCWCGRSRSRAARGWSSRSPGWLSAGWWHSASRPRRSTA